MGCIKMIKKHTLSLFILILLFFTACGGGSSDTASSNDVPISCEPAPLSLQKNTAYSTAIQINNPDNDPKILLHSISDTLTPLAVESIDFDKAGLYGLFQTEYYWASQTPTNIRHLAKLNSE